MRVLILEDDPWIADLLKQIVLSLCPGAQVDCQSRVADALAAWKRQAAQLVIADWHLPDGNGTQLLEEVRQRSKDIPLVMVTARADRDSVLTIRPLNISAFISKPFQVPKVIASLQPLLANAQTIAGEIDTVGDFFLHLETLADDALELPLRESLHQRLRDIPLSWRAAAGSTRRHCTAPLYSSAWASWPCWIRHNAGAVPAESWTSRPWKPPCSAIAANWPIASRRTGAYL